MKHNLKEEYEKRFGTPPADQHGTSAIRTEHCLMLIAQLLLELIDKEEK